MIWVQWIYVVCHACHVDAMSCDVMYLYVSQISETVWSENLSLLRSRGLFDPDYFHLIHMLMSTHMPTIIHDYELNPMEMEGERRGAARRGAGAGACHVHAMCMGCGL